MASGAGEPVAHRRALPVQACPFVSLVVRLAIAASGGRLCCVAVCIVAVPLTLSHAWPRARLGA